MDCFYTLLEGALPVLDGPSLTKTMTDRFEDTLLEINLSIVRAGSPMDVTIDLFRINMAVVPVAAVDRVPEQNGQNF